MGKGIGSTLAGTLTGAVLGAALVVGGTVAAQAAPVSVSGTGTVTFADGVWAYFLGSAVNANATIDLDDSIPPFYDKEYITPTGEDPFWRWTLNSAPFAPYGASFSGMFGTETTGSPWIETLDNFDLDANGNPFGATGIVDVLTIAGGNVVVDCSNGIVDPVTGCSDPDAPVIGGTEFLWHFAAAPGWFSGVDVLPSSLSPAGGFVGIYGEVELIDQGNVIGYVQVTFDQPVAEPAALGLFGLGLAGLGLAARRRRG
ncbi:MAG: hypothetical protein VW644_10210 [Alphaproteobacteria bacterium]